jgi:rRNA small subunit pseudouridine methyltransferase Nep1
MGPSSDNADAGCLGWRRVLTLVLADSELEPVPEDLVDHTTVKKPAERRGIDPERVILDASMHHWAIRDHELPEGERRGRPDLVHQFLLTSLDSPLNLEGGLRVRVHTRHDEMITVAPETRIMRAYPRFKGLMGKLFEQGSAGPEDKDLLTHESGAPLAAVLEDVDADHVIALDPKGEPNEPVEQFPCVAAEHDHVAIVLGGFPKGDYESSVKRLADETWTIHPERLSVWSAAAEVLAHWRHVTAEMSVHRGPKPRRPDA